VMSLRARCAGTDIGPPDMEERGAIEQRKPRIRSTCRGSVVGKGIFAIRLERRLMAACRPPGSPGRPSRLRAVYQTQRKPTHFGMFRSDYQFGSWSAARDSLYLIGALSAAEERNSADTCRNYSVTVRVYLVVRVTTNLAGATVPSPPALISRCQAHKLQAGHPTYAHNHVPARLCRQSGWQLTVKIPLHSVLPISADTHSVCVVTAPQARSARLGTSSDGGSW
jgi:hypothetical protein